MFGLLMILHQLLPSSAGHFLMYHTTGRLKGTLKVEGIIIRTDLFHALQVVDTFYFDGLERFPAFELTVVDVLAHHGMYSLKAALRGARIVIAIEPDPANFKLLSGNVSTAYSKRGPLEHRHIR